MRVCVRLLVLVFWMEGSQGEAWNQGEAGSV